MDTHRDKNFLTCCECEGQFTRRNIIPHYEMAHYPHTKAASHHQSPFRQAIINNADTNKALNGGGQSGVITEEPPHSETYHKDALGGRPLQTCGGVKAGSFFGGGGSLRHQAIATAPISNESIEMI
jgi:hypothetical protein